MKPLLSLCLLLSTLIFTSCSKTDHSPEPEKPVENSTLQTDLVGKWVVASMNGRATAEAAFLEFLADSTYIISSITEKIEIGKYLSVSDKSAQLDGFGEVTRVAFSQGKITCLLSSSAGRQITITAVRTPEVATDNRTKLLARAWALTSDEDGEKLLTSDSDPNVKFDMDFIFSAAGTYLVVYKFQGQIEPGVKGNWKWHSTDQDKIVWWREGDLIDENQNLVLRTLAADLLKITNKTDDVDFNLTLKP
jgi:hypothetical protein